MTMMMMMKKKRPFFFFAGRGRRRMVWRGVASRGVFDILVHKSVEREAWLRVPYPSIAVATSEI